MKVFWCTHPKILHFNQSSFIFLSTPKTGPQSFETPVASYRPVLGFRVLCSGNPNIQHILGPSSSFMGTPLGPKSILFYTYMDAWGV